MGTPNRKIALVVLVELACDVGGFFPVAAAFVNAQQGQQRLWRQSGGEQGLQSRFGAVQNASFDEVQRQIVLGAFAVGLA